MNKISMFVTALAALLSSCGGGAQTPAPFVTEPAVVGVLKDCVPTPQSVVQHCKVAQGGAYRTLAEAQTAAAQLEAGQGITNASYTDMKGVTISWEPRLTFKKYEVFTVGRVCGEICTAEFREFRDYYMIFKS
jgi:hypothetical protein